MRMLYVALYHDLLFTADFECRGDRGQQSKLDRCVAQTMASRSTPQLEENTLAALKLYGAADQHEFLAELATYLDSMAEMAGGQINTGAVLQLAADATGSATELVRDPKVHGNYVIDTIAGDIWARKGNVVNATKKYQHALADIDKATFPTESALQLAKARVYDRLAELDANSGDYANVIAYTEAAIALGGDSPNSRHWYECKAYYKLHLFKDGAAACARMLDDGAGVEAVVWRGMNEQAMGKDDAALADFRTAAATNERWGAFAVLQMSLIYGDRQVFANQVKILSSYPYLYDEEGQNANNLAVAYNNRCYGYMKLGELEKALADCTASLRYDSLPDAYAKQDQIVKMLKEKAQMPRGSDGPI